MVETKPVYHTRRVRSTCTGAGHTHCPQCDMSMELGRNDYRDLMEDLGRVPLCMSCYNKHSRRNHG